MCKVNLVLCLCHVLVRISLSQLVINVRNHGGDVLRESLFANTSDETITLEFHKSEGTHVTQFIDFKMEVQVFRVLILGEEEQGQNLYQVVCFVTRFNKVNFIPVDAMSKLRQRNPLAVREPEEERGREQLGMDLSVDLSRAEVISPHLAPLCKEAPHSTFAREADLRAWASARASSRDLVLLPGAVQPAGAVVPCGTKPQLARDAPCGCRLDVCVAWFPCGLKWCRDAGRASSFRCGIRTCRKCHQFLYPVRTRSLCLWE
ncbi:unnamed protein product [Ixodes persulcatus]